MLKHYIVTTWRSISKYPGYSGLNLAGLSLGMASAYMLLTFSYQELTYDQQFPGNDRIYRIASDFYNMGGFALSQEQLLDHLPNICPAVELSTRFKLEVKDLAFSVDNHEILEPQGYYADSNFFKMFPHQIIAGRPAHSLKKPDEVILSANLAAKLFGKKDVVGERIGIGPEENEYVVSAVVETSGSKTHLQGEYWLPLVLPDERQQYWTNVTYYNYVRLHPNRDLSALEQSLHILQRDYAHASNTMGMDFQDWASSNFAVKFFIQPLREIYLYSPYNFEIKSRGNPALAYALGIIGLFIILIAVANYLNLTTARASIRAKEVGVKKTLGITLRGLRFQFLLESIIFSAAAMTIGIVLTELLRMAVVYWTELEIIPSITAYPIYLVGFFLFAMLIGLVAGAYPAFYLTRFQPQKVIKGNYMLSHNGGFRNGLVMIQFGIATLLMVGCLVVYQQLAFLQSQDLGLNQHGIMIIDQSNEAAQQLKILREQLVTDPRVSASSICDRVPSGTSITMTSFAREGSNEAKTFQTFPVDDQFVPLMEMNLLQGRNFDKALATDTNAVILNEAAVAVLEFDQPVGQFLSGSRKIIGVVSDFHYQSLSQKIEPMVMTYSEAGSALLLKLSGKDMASFVQSIHDQWSAIEPDEKLNYAFMDNNFAKMARKEQVLARALTMFALLAVFIACLGLFGLVSFTAHMRSKEMSIRRILGATVSNNVSLIIRDFVKLIAVAMLFSIPLAIWMSIRWLQDFAFRMDLSAWIFILATGMVLLIALLTVGLQTLKVAMENPTKHLRNE